MHGNDQAALILTHRFTSGGKRWFLAFAIAAAIFSPINASSRPRRQSKASEEETWGVHKHRFPLDDDDDDEDRAIHEPSSRQEMVKGCSPSETNLPSVTRSLRLRLGI